MKIFNSPFKNIEYLIYRLMAPLLDPVKFFRGIYGYFWFFRDMIRYKLQDRKAKIIGMNLFPVLDEKVSFAPFNAHYFYQQIWCFDQVRQHQPIEHVDVGSTYELSGYISRLIKTTFVDLRPIKAEIDNLTVINGNILNLPFTDNSLFSLSCLHVVEHIGLGRYGDAINPKGSGLACRELARVLAPGGYLYFSLPIGRSRLCFNAHRVHDPETILQYFNDLELVSFAAVDDQRRFQPSADYRSYSQADYSCGLFIFTKK